MIPYLIAIVCVLIYVVYVKTTSRYSYWTRKGIKGPKPSIVIGNMMPVLNKQDSISSLVTKLYDEYPDEKFVGIYQGTSPTLVLKDPEMIKKVIIKDFASFTDRGFPTTDEPLTKNLFIEQGDNWRLLRQKLTPIFTTGKLKLMMPLITNCVDQYIQYVDKQVDSEGPHEIRLINMKYTLKVITTTAFGLNIDVFTEKKSQFVEMADKLFDRSIKHILVNVLQSLLPGLAEKLQIKLISEEISNFFFSLVNGIVKEREGKPKVRKDFMDLMIEMKEQGTITKAKEDGIAELEITESIMAAQAVLFYAAGFETSSGTMAFLMYELALNPDVQQKCYDEVIRIMEQYNGDLPYEALAELQYLNMAFDETLRKHPVGGVLFRQLVADSYNFAGELTVERGTKMLIPVPSLHMDPKYFPNPDQFDPTRFAPENRANIRDGTYLPFGDGPRNCIGMRFARVQSLLGAARFLHKFRVAASDRTVTHVRHDPLQPTLVCADGLWINIARR